MGDWAEVIQRVKTALTTHPHASIVDETSDDKPADIKDRVAARVRSGFTLVAETRVGILQYLPDEPNAGTSIERYGEYLQPQIELLTRFIRVGDTVLEVGAGVGVHSLPLAAAIREAGHLILYETGPVKRQILRNNLEANRVVNATLMKGSLGNAETLDELDLERLDWLKINDDTAALAILEGGADTLWRLRPRLFIATTDVHLTEVARAVREFGYRCWKMEMALFNSSNFSCRTENVFGDRTALALLAVPEEVEMDVELDGCIELR
jgi:precorrin-6B methylase 2